MPANDASLDPAAVEKMRRDAATKRRGMVRDLIRKHGGTWHGPHVEHLSMEEQAFWRMLDEAFGEIDKQHNEAFSGVMDLLSAADDRVRELEAQR